MVKFLSSAVLQPSMAKSKGEVEQRHSGEELKTQWRIKVYRGVMVTRIYEKAEDSQGCKESQNGKSKES